MENINISKRYIFFYLRLKTIKKRKNTSYLDNSLILFKDLLNWYLIHKSIFLKGILSDKINSCFIVSRIISNNICKKTYNYYSNPSNISINNQILKFALKANHGSGQNILVNNSQNFKIDEIKNKIKRWLMLDYGIKHKEFHYSYIKPKVFIEEFLENHNKILEYKILQLKNLLKFVDVKFFINNTKYHNFYDKNFNFLDKYNKKSISKIGITKIHQPLNFIEMESISKKLGNIFNQVRIDLYELNKKIILSEMTFTTNNMFINSNYYDFYLNYN